jgi:thioredoxin reductase (NADPH)
MHRTRVAIIGAGPIGIELAVALKQRDIPYVHLEARQVGATMFWWPAGTRWFSSNDRISLAGVPLQTNDQNKATREDYLRYLRSIVQQFDLRINTYEPVVSINQTLAGFHVQTASAAGPRDYLVNQVILATGGTAAPRKLGVPGESLPHVSHYMQDPHAYFRKRVLIVGGKNSAVEAALRLHNAGAEIVMSYRRAEFNAKSIKYWLYPEITGLIKSGGIEAHFNTLVSEIAPTGATLCPADDRRGTTEVKADFVLLLVGYVADMTLARLAGVKLNPPCDVPQYDERTMETNVPGVYIAGTAIAGTQDSFKVFLENCHVHVDRIVNALTGQVPPPTPEPVAMPES